MAFQGTGRAQQCESEAGAKKSSCPLKGRRMVMGTLPGAGVQGQHFAVWGRGPAAVRSLGFAGVRRPARSPVKECAEIVRVPSSSGT